MKRCVQILIKTTSRLSLLFVFSTDYSIASHQKKSPPEAIRYYSSRYDLQNPYTKKVDNRGNHFSELYGTRNFRLILQGVAYRGGANNAFHQSHKRDNRNPLPADGLENLCREGFESAIYLYPTGYRDAPKSTDCKTRKDGSAHQLHYLQKSPYKNQDVNFILEKIYKHIQTPALGPIYLHCWNGWHASGMISAMILRQFCDTTPEEAVSYWDQNTDGNNKQPRFEGVRKSIRDFKPRDDLKLTEDQKSAVCPHLK